MNLPLDFDRFRVGGWLVPGLCFALAAGLVVSRHAALVAATREEARAGADLQKARVDLDAVSRKPSDPRFTLAPRSTDEETKFLLDLRRRAHLCGVSIVRWNSHSADYTKKEGGDADQAVLEGVTKVTCDLSLTGSYPALRAFLTELWSSDRLLTVAHVDWTRIDVGSELNLSLGRYLAPKVTKS